MCSFLQWTTSFANDRRNDPRYTVGMSVELSRLPDPDELRRILAAHHATFNEQYKALEKAQAKWAEVPGKPSGWELSAATKEADAKLKALMDLLRKRRNSESISD